MVDSNDNRIMYYLPWTLCNYLFINSKHNWISITFSKCKSFSQISYLFEKSSIFVILFSSQSFQMKMGNWISMKNLQLYMLCCFVGIVLPAFMFTLYFYSIHNQCLSFWFTICYLFLVLKSSSTGWNLQRTSSLGIT